MDRVRTGGVSCVRKRAGGFASLSLLRNATPLRRTKTTLATVPSLPFFSHPRGGVGESGPASPPRTTPRLNRLPRGSPPSEAKLAGCLLVCLCVSFCGVVVSYRLRECTSRGSSSSCSLPQRRRPAHGMCPRYRAAYTSTQRGFLISWEVSPDMLHSDVRGRRRDECHQRSMST